MKQMVTLTSREITISRLQKLQVEYKKEEAQELERRRKQKELEDLEKPLQEAENDLRNVFFPLASRVFNLPESKLRSLDRGEIVEVGKMLFERKKGWLILDKLVGPAWLGSSAISGIAAFIGCNGILSGIFIGLFVAAVVLLLFGFSIYEPIRKSLGYKYACSYQLLKEHKDENYVNEVLLNHV